MYIQEYIRTPKPVEAGTATATICQVVDFSLQSLDKSQRELTFSKFTSHESIAETSVNIAGISVQIGAWYAVFSELRSYWFVAKIRYEIKTFEYLP